MPPGVRRGWRRRWLLPVAVLVVMLTDAWGLGFAWFAWQTYHAATPPPQADGIVVLTGGADRVDTGLRLLAEGKAPLLLISGVPPRGGPDLASLIHAAGLDPAPLAGKVTLGHAAATTLGNGAETADWARRHELESLIVVTASYHMPRALLELGRAMPGVALYPVRVHPPALRGAGFGSAAPPGTLRLLLGEYNKLLGAELGLSRLRGDRP